MTGAAGSTLGCITLQHQNGRDTRQYLKLFHREMSGHRDDRAPWYPRTYGDTPQPCDGLTSTEGISVTG
jgi:hypothetical protein